MNRITASGQIFRFSAAERLRGYGSGIWSAAINARRIWCMDDPMPSVAEFFLTLRRELKRNIRFSEKRDSAMVVGVTQAGQAARTGTAAIHE